MKPFNLLAENAAQVASARAAHLARSAANLASPQEARVVFAAVFTKVFDVAFDEAMRTDVIELAASYGVELESTARGARFAPVAPEAK